MTTFSALSRSRHRHGTHPVEDHRARLSVTNTTKKRRGISSSTSELRRHAADPLFSTSYLLLIAAAGASALGFVFWAVAAHLYSAQDIGRAGVLISAATFVAGMTAGGPGQVLVRFLPTSRASPSALVGRVYLFGIALSGTVGLATAKTATIWSPSLAFLSRDPRWTIGFTVGSIVLAVFILEDGALTGAGRANLIPFENISYAIGRLVLLGAGIASGLGGIFIAWSLPAAVAVAAITVLLFRSILPTRRVEQGELQESPSVLRFGLASWLGSALSLASATFMPVIVLNVVGPAKSASFYAASTIATGLALISVSTGTSLTAQAASARDRLPNMVRRAIRQSLVLSSAAALVVVVAAPLLMRLFGPDYAEGVTPLRLLAISTVPFAVSMIGLSVARVQESLRTILIWEGALCSIGLGLGSVLVSRYGVDGGAAAWVAAQSATALISLRRTILPLLRAHDRETTG
jgi:O-antigen/teichoic acid export membrane protein